MAKKANKKKSKDATRKSRWYDFPEQLNGVIDDKYNMYYRQMNNPGPIKAWGTSTRRCEINIQPHWSQLYEIGDPLYLSDTPQRYYSSTGIAFAPGFYPLTPCWLLLGKNYCILELTGISSPAFRVYHHEDLKWSTYDCTTVDPYGSDNEFMQFTNIINFQGKVYALSLQGTLAVVEDINENLKIKVLSKCRAIPSVRSKYYREHLLESNGEILLVFLVYQRSLSVVDRVEIFWFSFSTLEWIKIDKLGGRAVFLTKKMSIWINSSEVGCRGDCVYFTLDAGGDKWWIYDMGSDCLSVAWITKPDWTAPI